MAMLLIRYLFSSWQNNIIFTLKKDVRIWYNFEKGWQFQKPRNTALLNTNKLFLPNNASKMELIAVTFFKAVGKWRHSVCVASVLCDWVSILLFTPSHFTLIWENRTNNWCFTIFNATTCFTALKSHQQQQLLITHQWLKRNAVIKSHTKSTFFSRENATMHAPRSVQYFHTQVDSPHIRLLPLK